VQNHQVRNQKFQEKKISSNGSTVNNKNVLKPVYPSYPSSRINMNMNSRMNSKSKTNNTMYEIQQFCLDIKNSKKLMKSNTNEKKINNYNPRLSETVLLNDSEEITENAENYYSVMENNRGNSNVIKSILFFFVSYI